jgi:hypothetical protein
MLLNPFGAGIVEIPKNKLPFPYRKGNLYNIQYIVKWQKDGIRENQRHV